MSMINQSAHQRTGAGFSPLIVIAVIFLSLIMVEGLLAARFWLQLAAVNAPEGIRTLILDVTRPLVAPFADAQDGAQQVGSFERKTLLAGMAYLIGGVGLTVLTVLAGGLATGNEQILRRRRRSTLHHLEHPLMEHGSRLLSTATLSLSPGEATRQLRMLRLDNLSAELYVIPAAGGCIIAAFASPANPQTRVPLLGRIASIRESMAIRRGLRSLEHRFQTTAPPDAEDLSA